MPGKDPRLEIAVAPAENSGIAALNRARCMAGLTARGHAERWREGASGTRHDLLPGVSAPGEVLAPPLLSTNGGALQVCSSSYIQNPVTSEEDSVSFHQADQSDHAHESIRDFIAGTLRNANDIDLELHKLQKTLIAIAEPARHVYRMR